MKYETSNQIYNPRFIYNQKMFTRLFNFSYRSRSDILPCTDLLRQMRIFNIKEGIKITEF